MKGGESYFAGQEVDCIPIPTNGFEPRGLLHIQKGRLKSFFQTASQQAKVLLAA